MEGFVAEYACSFFVPIGQAACARRPGRLAIFQAYDLPDACRQIAIVFPRYWGNHVYLR